MNWGEIQIESLKKMYLNNDNLSAANLATYKTDKKYKTYLFAMPQACNEAIEYIANLEPVIKSYELTVTQERYDLSELINDYKCMDRVITNARWEMETDKVLRIDKNAGSVIIYYEANPTLVDYESSETEEFDISEECLRYVPLYIAGELYKDDDLSMATMYMNEFMNNIAAITGRVKNVNNNKIVPIYTMN